MGSIICKRRVSMSNTQVNDADLAKVAAEEKEVTFPKDFVVQPIDPDLVWKAKEALFDTRLDDCEGLVRSSAENNPWAMSLFAEAGLWRYIYERKKEDFEVAMLRMKTSAAMAGVLMKRHRK